MEYELVAFAFCDSKISQIRENQKLWAQYVLKKRISFFLGAKLQKFPIAPKNIWYLNKKIKKHDGLLFNMITFAAAKNNDSKLCQVFNIILSILEAACESSL